MISAIIFSKDRAAQLDLLLRSLRANARGVFTDTRVIWTATPGRADYAAGYRECAEWHPDVRFEEEHEFATQVRAALAATRHPHAAFFCDDNVLYRPLPRGSDVGVRVLLSFERILTVALRLGANTHRCYSLRQAQSLPSAAFETHRAQPWANWEWRHGSGDFGYPGSLDGNVWRTHQLRTLVGNARDGWASPNELEDALNGACKTALLPLMACYRESVLVGVPVNSVQTAYKPNRHAETHRAPTATLNRMFLEGRRLALDAIRPEAVDAAHVEFKLEWKPERVVA